MSAEKHSHRICRFTQNLLPNFDFSQLCDPLCRVTDRKYFGLMYAQESGLLRGRMMKMRRVLNEATVLMASSGIVNLMGSTVAVGSNRKAGGGSRLLQGMERMI